MSISSIIMGGSGAIFLIGGLIYGMVKLRKSEDRS